ncbi:Uncharacterised protein [Mycobacteroides abscessus]|nr:Uncharacterised protein [Mycobacteroides abscessus]
MPVHDLGLGEALARVGEVELLEGGHCVVLLVVPVGAVEVAADARQNANARSTASSTRSRLGR